MKKLARNVVAAILGYQVKRLYKKNKFKVVAVGGSVGKTSTKLAIASVLKAKYRVQYQDGNYNDLISVPLIFFGEDMPDLRNPLAWSAVFWRNWRKLRVTYPYDIVVVEAGTDAPGQIREFAKYLRADIGVITAITPEHMEYFDDVNAVAKEELGLAQYCDLLLYNKDLCDKKYLAGQTVALKSYALKQPADFRTINIDFKDDKCDFEVLNSGKSFLKAGNELISEPQLYSVTAAVAVAAELGMESAEAVKGLGNLHPVSGRMQRLKGINGSIIIDDTYNASPEAMKAALETLYRLDSAHKIAVLGNMNELGGYSQAAHEAIGSYCNPKRVDLVLTIGPDANRYLAPAAEAKGCKVVTFDSPYTIGDYLKPLLKKGSVVLVKGSQNGVFAEEAVKQILADESDASKLVRQGPKWMGIKHKSLKI